MSGQIPLDFSTPASRAPSARLLSSSADPDAPRHSAPSRYLTRREAAAYIRCSLRFLDGMGPTSAKAAASSTNELISMPGCSRINAEGGPGRRLYGP
jgi:hypothetical protein